jgi:antitoxin component YwqK of YwqJK toxin-antitoxin module
MKKDTIPKQSCEYHPNGSVKYRISHANGGEFFIISFHDDCGNPHKINGPNYQLFRKNGSLVCQLFSIHGKHHNISNPAGVRYDNNSKITMKQYFIENYKLGTKLTWQNCIKNI